MIVVSICRCSPNLVALNSVGSERDRAWRLLLRFDPEHQLTDPGIGPRMRASFESARRYMAKTEADSTTINRTPRKRPVAVFSMALI